MNNRTTEEIRQWIQQLRSRSGHDIVQLKKMWHTDSPSIQGMWTPFTNKDTKLNTTDFPDKDNFKFVEAKPSAQEKLMDLAKELKAKNIVHVKESNKSNDGNLSPH